MSLTYADERAVYFDPKRIKPGMCLECATPTTRISPRGIAARGPSSYGTIRILRLRSVLALCERCDARWTRATIIGLVLVFSPLWVPVVFSSLVFEQHWLPTAALGWAIGLSFPIALASWIWARSTFIQVRSIDEDGTIGLGNVHPETKAKIVELGEADYRA